MSTQGYPTPGGVLECDDGSIEIDGAGKVRLRALGSGAGALVTPFRMIPVPTATTSSVVPVDLMSATPVVVTAPGDILLDFDAPIQLTPPAIAPVTFQGVALEFFWDGATQSSTTFWQFDPNAATTQFDTIALQTRFRARIVGATVGNHTLTVRWSVLDATSSADTFIGNGNLTIQTAPR